MNIVFVEEAATPVTIVLSALIIILSHYCSLRIFSEMKEGWMKTVTLFLIAYIGWGGLMLASYEIGNRKGEWISFIGFLITHVSISMVAV